MQLVTKSLSALAISLNAMTFPAAADPVYMIAQIQIEDHEGFFDQYAPAAGPIVFESGARVLVATPMVDTLEGDWPGNWTVILEFPSEEAAMDGWYGDEKYQEAIGLRLANTSLNNLVVAPGFVTPVQ